MKVTYILIYHHRSTFVMMDILSRMQQREIERKGEDSECLLDRFALCRDLL